MVSEPPTSRLVRPQTLLDNVKTTLGDDVNLLDYLPTGVVHPDVNVVYGHVPYRIEFGRLPSTSEGAQTTVYAFMSASPREIPVINFYGARPHEAMKQYRQETVSSEGELRNEFKLLKDFTPAARVSLLQVCISSTRPDSLTIWESVYLQHIAWSPTEMR